MNKTPLDQSERERAIMTFDRNIMVTAGAGTGKTTLLINRLIHLMMRKPDPVKITEIVALTFTNKAAGEMKSRLREALEKLQSDDETENTVALSDRYGLSKDEMTCLAAAAIRQLERSEIGTLHHFATTLLRRYPLEAGVDPQFRIDEGGRVSESLFEETWMNWLAVELSANAPRKAAWQAVLPRVSLAEMREISLVLSSETLEMDALFAQIEQGVLSEPLRVWLQSLESAAETLLIEHPASRNIEKLLAAALSIFKKLQEIAPNRKALSEALIATLSEADQGLIRSDKKAGKVKGWQDDEIKEAAQLIKIARQMLQVDQPVMRQVLHLLAPFVKHLKKEMHRLGLISFDGLLIRARNLLRDHPAVREQLKGRYRAILIDEFQDTDPVQYEILLFLSEVAGEAASTWGAVKLSPGKLFVVGDPKQSIYGFRRADIAACQTVRELILDQNGIECLLTTNFRSHAGILDPVNGLFEKLIQAEDGRQPAYIAIHPADQNKASEETSFRQLVFRRVKNAASDEKGDADLARRLEGESIAAYLSETVIGKAMIKDRDGCYRPVQKADVAILMRSLTSVHFYLEALRRRGIAYLVEGERRFYQTQEVIDAVNLLRVVADPNDRLALVALLRSPVGALDDVQIYALHQQKQLSYLAPAKTATPLSPHIRSLYRLLATLHNESTQVPVGEAVAHIFETSPLMVLAAGSIKGEQALANLEKIQALAEHLSAEGTATFKEVVAILAHSLAEQREEPESPLAEEGIDAVKVFSVHKAKGLEFPVVILAGCHAGTGPQGRDRIAVRQDWSSGLSGIFVGDLRDLNSIYLGEKERLRAFAEEKRVLYVAMTRAREHLMLTAAATGKRAPGSFLSFLEAGLEEEIDSLSLEASAIHLPVGSGHIAMQCVAAKLDTPHRPPVQKKAVPQVDWQACADLWQKRRERYETIIKQPTFVTPTFLKRIQEAPEDSARWIGKGDGGRKRSGANGMLIGRLAHLFLEGWDFSNPPESYRDALSGFLEYQKIADTGESQTQIFEELETIFEVFFHSVPYEEICDSEIIGREIPFLLPWQGQVMEGVIDLLYEKSGALYIGEYKTDRVQKEDLASAAELYRHQTLVYPEAVRRALQRDVAGMNFIFLRVGLALELA